MVLNTLGLKKMFVSGNPTLPSKTPPTLKFFSDFEKKNENREKSVKNVYFHNFFLRKKKINKKKYTDRHYLFFFRPLPKTNIICCLGLIIKIYKQM